MGTEYKWWLSVLQETLQSIFIISSLLVSAYEDTDYGYVAISCKLWFLDIGNDTVNNSTGALHAHKSEWKL